MDLLWDSYTANKLRRLSQTLKIVIGFNQNHTQLQQFRRRIQRQVFFPYPKAETSVTGSVFLANDSSSFLGEDKSFVQVWKTYTKFFNYILALHTNARLQ